MNEMGLNVEQQQMISNAFNTKTKRSDVECLVWFGDSVIKRENESKCWTKIPINERNFVCVNVWVCVYVCV